MTTVLWCIAVAFGPLVAGLLALRFRGPCKLSNGSGEVCGRRPVTHLWHWGDTIGGPEAGKTERICDRHAQCFAADECEPLRWRTRRTKGSPGWRPPE